ncbi:glycoside hydrolase family protein [Litoreibacter sp.]|jgi:lysozyme|nr:glycoside hydrolase family protein [Litoreibacter sp.]
MSKLIETLRRHEGVKNTLYKCTSDKWTIGVGRNLEDVGLSEEEIDMLLLNDIKRTKELMDDYIPWHNDLDEVRQEALINFVFNVGIGTTMKFKNAMAALEAHDYDTAAIEMLDSNWAKQVGSRAEEVTQMIKTGEYQD